MEPPDARNVDLSRRASIGANQRNKGFQAMYYWGGGATLVVVIVLLVILL